jgi:hypothetical protein
VACRQSAFRAKPCRVGLRRESLVMLGSRAGGGRREAVIGGVDGVGRAERVAWPRSAMLLSFRT